MSASVIVTETDLDHDFYWHATESRRVAWDIETTGLDWSSDLIATCQIATRSTVNIVRLTGKVPKRLLALLESADVEKIFHHAPFDARFMAHHWDASPRALMCTKVASKILEPALDPAEHSLMPVLERHLGVLISKSQQQSNWLQDELTDEQLAYAADDVRYLHDLADVLLDRCVQQGLDGLVGACWDFLPTRVALDLRRVPDVFVH